MMRRRDIIVIGVAAAASAVCPARATTPGFVTYLLGCFYDAGAAAGSDMMRYLILPERTRVAANLAADQGGELRSLAEEVLRDTPAFVKAASLGHSQETGNPLFLGITRAMHETFVLTYTGLPDEYLTIVSVTATLDVVTSTTAFRNTNRFESLTSLLLVTNQPFKQRTAPSEAELQARYRQVAKEALAGVLERGTREFADNRQRAKGVFQVTLFKLPDPLPAEIDQLIASAIKSDASVDRASEIDRLTRECQHMLSFGVQDELDRRKVLDIAVIPSQSPWTTGRALRQLQTRLRLSDEPIIATPDPAKMNGYEIRSAIVKTWCAVAARTAVGQLMSIDVQTASRIVRQCGSSLHHMPDDIADPARKIGMGYGVRNYARIAGFERVATRDVAMGALRDSLIDLSKQTVDLMQKTVAVIGCS
jgi:hypothetical protein